MDKEVAINLLNSALDVLYDCFGAEWLVGWGIDNDMSDDDILDYLVDAPDLLERVKLEGGED